MISACKVIYHRCNQDSNIFVDKLKSHLLLDNCRDVMIFVAARRLVIIHISNYHLASSPLASFSQHYWNPRSCAWVMMVMSTLLDLLTILVGSIIKRSMSHQTTLHQRMGQILFFLAEDQTRQESNHPGDDSLTQIRIRFLLIVMFTSSFVHNFLCCGPPYHILFYSCRSYRDTGPADDVSFLLLHLIQTLNKASPARSTTLVVWSK